MSKIYLLRQKKVHYFDEEDSESVESTFTIGYLSSKKLEEGKACCLSKGVPKEEIDIEEYDMGKRGYRRFIYVLRYEFTRIKQGEYHDYYYHFPPLRSKTECLRLKQSLLLQKKYQADDSKIYEDTPDGFFIDKVEVDYMFIPKGTYNCGFL